MAVYNGAGFLMTQLESILEQLARSDDLCVVDDASQDGSVEIITRVGDDRVRLVRNQRNVGVVKAFEQALRLARGEIVFLSDQDDLWLPGKVEKTLAVFAKRSDVTMVATDASIIDEKGRTIAASFFAQRGAFSPGFLSNFLKNKCLGCTLAFRRSMLERFLPIPADVPMHDIWFGLLNAIYGTTYFIAEPLTAYRRHGSNRSPRQHAGLAQMTRWRVRLLKNLATRVARGSVA